MAEFKFDLIRKNDELRALNEPTLLDEEILGGRMYATRTRLGPRGAAPGAASAAAEAEVKKEVQAMVARAMRAVEARYDRKPSIFDPRKI